MKQACYHYTTGTTVPTLPGWTDGYPLVEVFEGIFRSRLVPSSIGCFSLHRAPWSSWPARSSRLLTFLSCCDEISSLWMSSLQSGRGGGSLALPPFLSCPRCVRFPSTLLFSGLFSRPGFFGILCLVASRLVCRRLLLRRRAPLVLLALLGDGPRLLRLLASLARRRRITRISAVSSSPGGSGRSGGQRKAQGRSQPDGTTLPMRMLSGLPPL